MIRLNRSRNGSAHTFDEGATKNGKTIYTCTACGYEKGEDEVKIALAEAQAMLKETQKALEEKISSLTEAEEKLSKAKAEIEELKNGEDTSCPYCGKEKHESFFDKVLCFFRRIGYFFKILFDFSMDKKN